jgi:hypothetical protein
VASRNIASRQAGQMVCDVIRAVIHARRMTLGGWHQAQFVCVNARRLIQAQARRMAVRIRP